MTRIRALALMLAALLLVPLTARAQSSRVQLDQLVQQVQSKPDDDTLREAIIKLVAKLKPKPVLPDEAERRMARGIAAFKAAQSVTGYQNAATEFRQAALVAPWYGDAYYNLGVAQDKAELYDAALRSLKFALLASPGSKEIKGLTYQVEYRRDQANDPKVKALKELDQDYQKYSGLIQRLDGAIYIGDFNSNGRVYTVELRFHGSGADKYLYRSDREKLIQGSEPGRVLGQWRESDDYRVVPEGDSKILGRALYGLSAIS